MSNNKMKGLLKGLRYISQIFENEKEPEMQIGLPTDVKHVAHIGWDGPSVNNPSWMNDFKSQPGGPSAPPNGDLKPDSSIHTVSQDPNQTGRDMPELPKSSRRQSSTVGGSAEEKTKSKKSSKSKESSSSSSDCTRQSRRSTELNQGTDSPTHSLPGAPKKGRRKKSKEEGSTKLKSKATAPGSCSSQFSDAGSDAGSVAGSVSRSNDDDLLTRDGDFT